MPTTPAHSLSLALTYLRATIDSSPLWRALCAAPELEWDDLAALADLDTSPSAAARITIGMCDDESASLPRCWIRYLASSDLNDVSTTGMDLSGELLLHFQVHVPSSIQETGDLESAYIWWTNVLGRTFNEMRLVRGMAGFLDYHRVSQRELGMFAPDSFPDGRWRMSGEYIVSFQGDL